MRNLIYIPCILLISLFSCTESKEKDSSVKEGHAILVAYEVSPRSKMWFKNLETGKIQIKKEFGARIPTLSLGDTIDVKYYNEGQEVHMLFDGLDYAQLPEDRTSRFSSLPGYENVR